MRNDGAVAASLAQVRAAPPLQAVSQSANGWESRVSRSTGVTYFVNNLTGESSLEPPRADAPRPTADASAVRWMQRVSRTTGATYFVNLASGQAQAQRPPSNDIIYIAGPGGE